MANPYYPNYFGGAGSGKSLEQLMQENQMLQSQMSGYAPPQAVQQPIPMMQRRGEYVNVKSVDEMHSAATRLDGTPTLFIDEEHGVFWSKKYVNGSHSVQAFSFAPLVTQEAQNDPSIKIVDDTPDDKVNSRLTTLESNVSEIGDMVKKLLYGDKKTTEKAKGAQ